MGLLLTVTLMVATFLLIRNIFFSGMQVSKTEEEANLDRILENEHLGDLPAETYREREAKNKVTFSERLARRIGTSDLFSQDEGQTFLSRLDQKLLLAGVRDKMTPEQALAKALIIWTLGFAVPLLMAIAGALPEFLAVVVMLIFFVYPPMKLKSMIRARQDSISAEVPSFINDLYMALSSGMSTIDRAIVRVAQTAEEDPYESILAREFYIAQVEYSAGGKSMEDALRGVSHRTGVVSVENLIEALVQGVRTGAPLEQTLLEYSTQAREIWRQDIRTFKNQKQPIITLFVVVTMFGGFILLVAPLIIQVFTSLSNLGG